MFLDLLAIMSKVSVSIYFFIIICSRVKQSIIIIMTDRYRQLAKAAISEWKKWYRDIPSSVFGQKSNVGSF